ncbi:UTR7 [Symbiodinium sp. CCMP2456]|nr:UTR7 [Symbiodinium sp. CCMP2456]
MTVADSPETVLLERSVKGLSAKGKPQDGVRVYGGTVTSMLPTESTKSISVALYVLSSLAMTSLTKYAASAWQFPGSSLLLLIECWATVAALYVYQGGYQPWSWRVLQHLPLATVAKALNMYLSFIAMRRTSLPVYNILKRLQPVYAMVQDWYIRGTCPDAWECLGVALISAGTVVTGIGDLDFDLVGYMLALSAAGCQSLYLVLARNAQDRAEMSSMDLVFYTAFYNSILFVPLTAVELPSVASFLQGPGEVSNLVLFMLPYVFLGAVLNFSTFWCTAENSPLATAVAGTSKGILSTVVGMLLFGAHLTALGWIGLAGSTAGGFVYSWAHARSSRSKSSKRTS